MHRGARAPSTARRPTPRAGRAGRGAGRPAASPRRPSRCRPGARRAPPDLVEVGVGDRLPVALHRPATARAGAATKTSRARHRDSLPPGPPRSSAPAGAVKGAVSRARPSLDQVRALGVVAAGRDRRVVRRPRRRGTSPARTSSSARTASTRWLPGISIPASASSPAAGPSASATATARASRALGLGESSSSRS